MVVVECVRRDWGSAEGAALRRGLDRSTTDQPTISPRNRPGTAENQQKARPHPVRRLTQTGSSGCGEFSLGFAQSATIIWLEAQTDVGHNERVNAPSSAIQAPPTQATRDILVVGGGIVGLACAEALALRGLQVTLVDREDPKRPAGLGASWASAGMIAPLAEVPEGDPFLDVCLRSRDLWTHWAPELEDATGTELDGGSLDYDRSGAFLVADRPHVEPDRLERFAEAARRAGEPLERPSPEAVRRSIPDASTDLDFGLRLAGEHRVDNRRVCIALHHRLRSLGVELMKADVRSIEAQSGEVLVHTARGALRSGAVLVAAGAWSARIAGLPELPISPLRGQMMRLAGVDWPFQGCVRGTGYYAVRRRNGDLLIGATEDDAGFDCAVTPAGLAELTTWLGRVFPTLVDHPISETWAGLRPSTPDGRPILEQVEKRVWVAAGHHRNGILLTPWTAQTMARWIVEGSPPAERDLFALGRFAALRSSA